MKETNIQINLSTKEYNNTNRAFYWKGALHGALSGWVVSLFTIAIGYSI